MDLPRITRSLGLAAITISVFTMAKAFAQSPEAARLQIVASQVDGSYSLSAPGIDGSVLHATAAVKVGGKWLHSKDYPKHLVSSTEEAGELGALKTTSIRYSGREDAPDLLVRLRTYKDVPFGDMQVTAVNGSTRAFEVQSLRVLESDQPRKGGALINLGASPSADRVLSDSFSEDRPAMQLRDISAAENHIHRAVGVQLLYNQQSKQSWFLGALTSDKFLSVLRLHMAASGKPETMTSYEVDSTGTTELLVENSLQTSSAQDRVELSQTVAPGKELASERMLFSVGKDYHHQLETYARLIRDLHHARVTAPTPIGWWSWTAFYFGLNQETALTNAQWLSQHLKMLGYTFFHMDEGYQFARGEYATADASLFPNGVGALEQKVLQEGLTAGIWTAPFEVSERSFIYTHHPEWLVHNAQGAPIHIGFVLEGVDHLYALDTTNPEAQAYLRATYSTLVQKWGIRYIKMDFMEDSAIEGFYHKPQTTALEAQRIGIQTIRDAVGPDVLLDKDGCELLNPVGLVDAGRISQDTGHTFSASRDAASGIAARYYMNRNYFLADPDAFSVSTQTVDDQSWHGGEKPLTLEEARVSIALTAVSGGLFEIGDDLPTLGDAADRLALVEDHDLLDMARLGKASVPLDLMTYDAKDLQPSIFLLKQTSRQSMLTIFNWSEQTRVHTLTREQLHLDPTHRYSVSEVARAASEASQLKPSLEVTQPAHSVRLFKIVDTGVPAAAPVADGTVPASAKAGEVVRFDAITSGQDNPALGYEWDFGDGVKLAGPRQTHAYTHAATYTARLKVTGFAPESNTKSFVIEVTGSVNTKYEPESKRGFVEKQP